MNNKNETKYIFWFMHVRFCLLKYCRIDNRLSVRCPKNIYTIRNTYTFTQILINTDHSVCGSLIYNLNCLTYTLDLE